MQNVNSRVEQLERATGARACPGCGTLPDGRWPDDVTCVVDTNPVGRPFVPEFCPECGRQINCTLAIGTAGRGDE